MNVENYTCPQCSKILDAATSAKGDSLVTPAEGDLSVCFYCGTLLKFGWEGMEYIEEKDLQAIHPDDRRLLEKLREQIQKKNAVEHFNRLQDN